MKPTSLAAAVAGAVVALAAVIFALRPPQLFVHESAAPKVDVPDVTFGDASHRRAPARESATRVVVYVAGAVVHPGIYTLAADARANDAVTKAGGPTHDADLVAVNLAAHVADGDEVAVPRIGDVLARGARDGPRSRSQRHRHARGRRSHRRTVANVGSPLDVNTADETALAELPGIGPALAERIVEFRSLNGPFASLDGLADVSGMTASRLDEVTPMLRVGSMRER